MPPRVSASRLAQPQTCQCFRTRPQFPQPSEESPRTRRAFHVSSRDATRLRANMWEWLTGPGKAFRDPLAGSTNYLGAYDKQGNLLRARRDPRKSAERAEPVEDEDVIVQREVRAGLDDEQMERNATDRAAKRLAKAELDERGGIPPERQSDLRPYPLNQSFRSQPVLSEALREQLYIQIEINKQDLSSVAAAFGVDIRRVAAAVRLKAVEKQWEADGKQLAKPYSEAVLAMLPQTPFRPETYNPITPHEPINDLPVHPRTRQQIFYPASESRHFTREDAAKVFDKKLLPADARVPLPMLIELERWKLQQLPRDERVRRQREKDDAAHLKASESERKKAEWEQRTQRVVPGRRWDFKFQDISAEKVDKHGRGRDAVGYRYGMPHEDRKRGMVKIPTSVE